MKHYLVKVIAVVAVSAGPISTISAADYADLSNDEMVQIRSQARAMAPEDRDNYRTEMQSRMQSMSSDERALFREMNEMSGQGNGKGKMNRYGQGNNNGSGDKYRQGQGSTDGSGNMYRYGQSDSQGYGSRQGGGNGRGRHGR